MIDLHSHTTRCLHAAGSMESYVQNALKKGIHYFGFSDHSPWMLHTRHKRYAMLESEMDSYVNEVKSLQQKYNRTSQNPKEIFQILLGMEMDFIPSRLKQAQKWINAYDWDYLIGSVHNIGFEKLQNEEFYHEWDIDDVCELYFEQMHRMINSGFCDIIAHFDLPKKKGHRPQKGWMHYIEPLIPDLKKSGMVLEINTSGKDHQAAEYMPSAEIAGILNEEGIGFTIGCDSHTPEDVGRYLFEALAELKKQGISQIFRFEKRKPIPVLINEIEKIAST